MPTPAALGNRPHQPVDQSRARRADFGALADQQIALEEMAR